MSINPNGGLLLTSGELENLLRVGRGWAAKDRCGRALIPFVRVGRAVRYRQEDVERYLEGAVRLSTADPGSADGK